MIQEQRQTIRNESHVYKAVKKVMEKQEKRNRRKKMLLVSWSYSYKYGFDFFPNRHDLTSRVQPMFTSVVLSCWLFTRFMI